VICGFEKTTQICLTPGFWYFLEQFREFIVCKTMSAAIEEELIEVLHKAAVTGVSCRRQLKFHHW
jgi:hypothetical protein